MLIEITGYSGIGKTTIGNLLKERKELNIIFFDELYSKMSIMLKIFHILTKAFFPKYIYIYILILFKIKKPVKYITHLMQHIIIAKLATKIAKNQIVLLSESFTTLIPNLLLAGLTKKSCDLLINKNFIKRDLVIYLKSSNIHTLYLNRVNRDDLKISEQEFFNDYFLKNEYYANFIKNNKYSFIEINHSNETIDKTILSITNFVSSMTQN